MYCFVAGPSTADFIGYCVFKVTNSALILDKSLYIPFFIVSFYYMWHISNIKVSFSVQYS